MTDEAKRLLVAVSSEDRRQAEADQELLDQLDAYLMAASYDEEPIPNPATSRTSVRKAA
jgi:hypothetical protein